MTINAGLRSPSGFATAARLVASPHNTGCLPPVLNYPHPASPQDVTSNPSGVAPARTTCTVFVSTPLCAGPELLITEDIQCVRIRSAKPLFGGSIPPRASNHLLINSRRSGAFGHIRPVLRGGRDLPRMAKNCHGTQIMPPCLLCRWLEPRLRRWLYNCGGNLLCLLLRAARTSTRGYFAIER